jgi:hypothetical protein
MTPAPQNFWEALFPAPMDSVQCIRLEMRLLRKGGRPFMLLPGQPGPAAATMDLYPAQTSRARAVRTLLRLLLRASLPVGSDKVSLRISPGDPFVRFLSSLVEGPAQPLPTLGILAGNPMTEGQRFLVLVFDPRHQPVAVVKTGLSERAQALIEREQSFLSAVPANTAGVPKLRAAFQSPQLRAVALDFCAGDSPRPHQEHALAPLLESWIDRERKVAVTEAPDWVRLEKACAGKSLFPVVAALLRGRTIRAGIHHGDFAPWNIKVSPAGSWTVIDWERGELTGIPGWDWFHYVIQSAILVGRLPTSALVQRLETLLSSAAFQQYATRGDILGAERGLLLAYLLHVVEVLKPSEGVAATQELLTTLSTRWLEARATVVTR